MSTLHPSTMPTMDRPPSHQRLLNIGCGDRPAPDPWLNCDLWPGVGPDLVMDARHTWPFDSASVLKVFMGQVIEHLDYPWGVRKALKEACRVLVPGGQLVVITPDFLAIKEKKAGADVWRAEARGMCRWPGDEHRWMPTRHIVQREMSRRFGNGLILNHLNLSPDWPQGSRNPWDCCVLSVKS